MTVEFVIDGSRVTSLEAFWDEVSRTLLPSTAWGRNLDAFNDILRGGFGTPQDGFILRWLRSDVSRMRLGYPETARQLELRLARCHPTNRQLVERQLELARRGIGPTVFDWLVEMIRDHGAGGEQAEDNVDLILE